MVLNQGCREHLEMLEMPVVVTVWGGHRTGIRWVETWDAAHPTAHGGGPATDCPPAPEACGARCESRPTAVCQAPQRSCPLFSFFFFNLFSPVNLFLFSFLHIYLFGCTGSSLWHVGSSPLTEPRAPALGAQSLRHWTTGEIPHFYFLKFYWCTVDLQC